MKRGNLKTKMKGDIDVKSDLLMGLMNLIEAEHHARFSWYSTRDKSWLTRLNNLRIMRSKIMPELEKEEDSQLHCYNKHLLSATFRFWEVGDKFLADGNMDDAIEQYNNGFALLEEFITTNILGEEEQKSFLEKIKRRFN